MAEVLSGEFIHCNGKNRKIIAVQIPKITTATTTALVSGLSGSRRYRIVGWVLKGTPTFSYQFVNAVGGALTPVFDCAVATAGGGTVDNFPTLGVGYGDSVAGSGVSIATTNVSSGALAGFLLLVDLDG